MASTPVPPPASPDKTVAAALAVAADASSRPHDAAAPAELAATAKPPPGPATATGDGGIWGGSGNDGGNAHPHVMTFTMSPSATNVAHREDVPPNGGYGWVCTACVLLMNANTWGVNAVGVSFLVSSAAREAGCWGNVRGMEMLLPG